MKTPKNKDFDSCMKTILENCDTSDKWIGSSLDEFCKDFKRKTSLFVLESNGYIRLITADDSTVFAVILLENGYQYFAKKEEKRKDFIKSFFSNFITGFLSGVLVTVVGSLILNRLI